MSIRFKKAIVTLTTVATTLSMGGFAAFVPAVAHAVAPADYGLTEGDVIRATGDIDVYIVNEMGYKRLFVNPQIFNIYGHLGFDKVKEVSPAVRDAFPTSGLFRVDGEEKVYGLDVISEDVANLRWVNTSGAQAVADDANFFKKVFVINASEKALYGTGADFTSVNQVPDYSRGETGSTPTGPISVSLASDNPAAGTLVKSQAIADLAHFQFSGSSAVTSLVLERIGVSADTDLSNVYLYEGVNRLTDPASVADGKVTFNDTAGLFTVAGTKTISVRADLSSSTGNTVGVKLVSVNGNAVNISGNIHSVANATLGTVTLTDNTDPSASGTSPGLTPANDVIAWRQTVAVNTRYANMYSLKLRVIGSVLPGDLRNFRLQLAGTQIGAVAQVDSNGYLNFDFSNSPVKLDTGSRQLRLLVDVIGGSGRNFTVSFRRNVDLYVVDSQYNQPIVVTAASGSFPSDGGQQDIASGVLTITKKTDSPAGDVVKDAAGVVLARFEFKATGESMKVENLRAYYDESDDNVTELSNGAIFADGVQVGSTQDILETVNGVGYTEYSLGSSLVVVPGTPRIVEIRADIADGDATDNMTAGETLTAGFVVGDSNVQRLTTLDFVNSDAKDGNQLTIRTGSFTAAKDTSFANQFVISPSTNVKIGQFTLTAASSEDINVNTINIDDDEVAAGFRVSETTDMYLVVKNDTGGTVVTTAVKAAPVTNASNSYSVNFTLPVNKTYRVEVWANVDSGLSADDSFTLDLDASGITTDSSTSVTATAAVGQTITSATGTLNNQIGSVPAASLRAGGITATGYAFTLQPQFDSFTLEEVYVDLSSTVASSTGAVANLFLKADGSTIGTAAVNATTASASFTGLNYSLPATGGAKTFTVDVQFANVGLGFNDTGGNVTVQLDGFKYRNSSGTPTTTTGLTTTTNTGNANIVHTAYPVFANVPNATTLVAGENTLLKTTVASSNGTIGLYRLAFSITTNANPTIDETAFKLVIDGTDVTSSLGSFATASNGADLTASGSHTGVVAYTFTNEYAVGTSPKTIELRGTVNSIYTGANAVTTKIANPSASATTDDAVTVASTLTITSPTVVWTDRSAATHSTSSDDWMNDFLVKTINTSQTLQVSI